MESLHVSFQRVVDAGLFKGIVLAHSLHLSHMFYADDAIFMGQWSESNIDIIVHVLECFHRASGLRINMAKSKLMGIFVNAVKVEQAAAKIGCVTLKTPFTYLGACVGDLMSRLQSWNEIVESKKVKSTYPSLWLNIIHEVELLKLRGIDLISFIHSKLGNGVNTSGGVEQVQFGLLKEKVEGCVLVNMKDKWVWSLEGSGDFSVASVRKLIDGVLLPEVSTKTRWIKAFPSRLMFTRGRLSLIAFLPDLISLVEIMRKISHWWDIGYMEITSYEEWLDWIVNLRLSLKYKRIFEDVKLRLVGLSGSKTLILFLCNVLAPC
ncbi:hypothetical protein Tco_0247624 [Tanacetum coccineum]